MDKKQQIEEMARLVCEHFDYDMVDQTCKKCKTYDKHCYTIHQAEILYNAGYRKIDDDCAVINKAELKQYKAQAVKDTAKEILQYVGDLYDDCDQRFYLKDYQWHKNLCKKYGV